MRSTAASRTRRRVEAPDTTEPGAQAGRAAPDWGDGWLAREERHLEDDYHQYRIRALDELGLSD